MKNEVWGYARVSTKEQNLARQIEQLKEFGISERNIKCDKISGKTFNRMEYNALVGTETTAPTLREGDLLVIVSLDRLGRNYTEIKEQWNYIINVIGADFRNVFLAFSSTTSHIFSFSNSFCNFASSSGYASRTPSGV